MEPFPDRPNLSCCPRAPPHNPSELLGSPRIAEIISELAADASMVILDAPPLNPVADAQVLLEQPAIHSRDPRRRASSRTTRDEVRRARAILDRHIVEPVGHRRHRPARRPVRYGYDSTAAMRRRSTADVDAPSAD